MKIIGYGKNKEKIFEEEADTRIYTNAPFVKLAFEYNLIKLPDDYWLNTKESLEKRLETRLTPKAERKLLKKLKEDVKKETNPKITKDTITLYTTFYNFEDINYGFVGSMCNIFENSNIDAFKELVEKFDEYPNLCYVSILND